MGETILVELNLHTLNVSRNGLNRSHDIKEHVDEPYQATCACAPADVPSSLHEIDILRTFEINRYTIVTVIQVRLIKLIIVTHIIIIFKCQWKVN